jgi:hypothetical protein
VEAKRKAAIEAQAKKKTPNASAPDVEGIYLRCPLFDLRYPDTSIITLNIPLRLTKNSVIVLNVIG